MTGSSPPSLSTTTRPSKSRRVGVLGGTFDPPHRGHIDVATSVRDQLDLDEVMLVVANDPWQKTGDTTVSPAVHRLELTQTAAAGLDRIVVSDIEIRRGGPSYMVETLSALMAANPDSEFFLIVGDDAAAGITTWHRHELIPDLATVVVVGRAGHEPAALPDGWPHVRLTTPAAEISSSDVRRRIATSQPDAQVGLSTEVSQRVSELGLYRPGLRVASAQINTVVGDIDANVAKAIDHLERAAGLGADIVLFPEMAITGYPPEDLLHKPRFVDDARAALEKFAAATTNTAAIIGFPERSTSDTGSGRPVVFNAAAICSGGAIHGVVRKQHLPNYDVFDERRNFRPGVSSPVFEVSGTRVGVVVCEDAWIDNGPVAELADAGAEIILSLNASPFRTGKQRDRETVMAQRVVETGLPLAYVNLVGAQDDLVFDGGSFAMVPRDGGVVVTGRAPSFVESLDVFELAISGDESPVGLTTDDRETELADMWHALTLGLGDYVRKSGFTDVALGVSGGVDSSLVAALAVDALGADHVHGVLMPSRFSSDHSVTDALTLADNLGMEAFTVPIEDAHTSFASMLAPHSLAGELEPGGLTDQNLQSRIRGVLLMALSNERGWLIVTPGNKSEAAVGYSTLYGDTAGAFAAIKDVWKTEVYELCRWRNRQRDSEIIPESVLTKKPSAELAPGQTDDQSLPDYDVLDPILRSYVEDDLTVTEIVERTDVDAAVVQRVCRLVDIAEYKRRQTPLGTRVSSKAFGRDRRVPVVNRYRG